MMDRNSVIGLVLIFLILIGTIFINRPTVEEAQRMQREQDSLARVVQKRSEDSLNHIQALLAQRDSAALAKDSLISQNRLGSFAALTKGNDGVATLENESIRMEVSNKGGFPSRIWLKPYKRASREGEEPKDSLVLFEGRDNHLNYTFATVEGKQVRTDELFFEPSASYVKVNGDSATLTMTASLGSGVNLSQVYTLYASGWKVGYTLKTEGFDKVLSPSNRDFQLDWSLRMPLQEQSVQNERDQSSVFYRYKNGDFDNISERSYEETEAEGGSLQWVSFKQQFFNSTLISKGDRGFEEAKMESELPETEDYVKKLRATMYLEMNGTPSEEVPMEFYFGPNHYQTLKKSGYELQNLVPLGWGIFGWVNRFVVIPVFNWLNDYFNSYGLIILLLTIIIKLGLFPLVYRSYVSTAKMRVLKPEMDELKAKFGSDPQKMQAETMKLYRKAGVNPLGGCVPMLLQMPILFAMFRFFPVSFELRQQAFLWAHDLSTYDSIWTFGHIPVIDFLYGDHVSLFTLLMTISTLLYTHFNNQVSGLSGQMKYIGYIMPVVFLGFFNKYAAGLSYYYFLSNMITFGQQFLIRRFVDDDKIHAKLQENKKKPAKKSRFAERIEQMAKQQQMQQQQRGKKKK